MEPRALETALGYAFRDRDLLVLALTHPSLAHESGVGPTQQHNQRLEFLGDAVLQIVITSELFQKFPSYGEGPLTQARAQLVNRTSLAAQGRRLQLGDHLILSRGEETTGGRTRTSTIADAFEAVIGAVFMDAGYDVTRDIILRLFVEEFGELTELPSLTNPKGELQELLQATSPEPPRYEQISVSGPDHFRQFECAVLHLGVELGRGVGRSKKLAESAAALTALSRLRGPVAVGLAPPLPEPGPSA
ncbi:MAG: ribonuclease III [Verrucomicrobia bacterium]|nr:ribonuclease III [Verrucomicrobiota bacterium]